MAPGEHELGTYPENKLIGIFDDQLAADRAAAELLELEFERESLIMYCGTEGAKSIDPSGVERGPIAMLMRGIQHLFADVDSLDRYAEAAEGGGCVLAVHVDDDVRRDSVRQVYERHGAREVKKFGRMTVETLDGQGTPRRSSDEPEVQS